MFFFLIILLGAFLLRFINLDIIPIFADEAIYVHWSQIAWHDHTKRFIALTDGKPPLHSWLMIPFLKIIKDPLVAGRLLSVLAGLFTLIGIYLIVKDIFDKKIATLAAFLTAISPFLVFYDRLAVADSLLTTFGVWSFYLGLQLIKKPDLGKSFLLGFCWAGGLLTKQPALYFIALLPSLFLLKKNKKISKILLASLLSLLIAILGYNIIKLSPYSHLISSRSYDYVLTKKDFLKHPLQLFWGNLRGIIYWIYSYQGVIATIFFFLGLVVLLIKINWQKGVVFLSWILVPILASAAIGKIIFPRYFLFIQPWLIILIAFAIDWLKNEAPRAKARDIFSACFGGAEIHRSPPNRRAKADKSQSIHKNIYLVFYMAAFIPWLIFSCLIVFNPTKAPLIKREQNQYLTTWSSGYGIKEIATYLKENYPKEKVYVATEGYFGTLPDGLQVYLDGFPNIEVYGVGQPLDKVPKNTLEKAKEAPTYLVINDSRYRGGENNLELIEKFQKPEFPFLKESLLFFKVKLK